MWPKKIQQFILTQNQPKFRTNQAIAAFCKFGAKSFADVRVWPNALRETADKTITAMSFVKTQIFQSRDRSTYKATLQLIDGSMIETVLMSPKPGVYSVCISSQVGCAMNCAFCATGKMGLQRSLTAEEIIDQVLFWIQYNQEHHLFDRLHNIVYMGMGEPLANLTAVEESLRILIDSQAFNFSTRHISVSTSGLVPGIAHFAKHWPQINLAVSLHNAIEDERTELMPINKTYSLVKLQKALQNYFHYANRKVFIEYILLKDRNDTTRHAKALIDFIQKIDKPQLLHVNLIIYNETQAGFAGSSKETATVFMQKLKQAHISVTMRKNMGRDISGACGQLAGKNR